MILLHSTGVRSGWKPWITDRVYSDISVYLSQDCGVPTTHKTRLPESVDLGAKIDLAIERQNVHRMTDIYPMSR